MNRELALKIVLAVGGLLLIALGYPMVVFIRQDPALSMQFSLYVTLGIFLLLAIRDPSASRSVIAFTAWSSFAHAALMGTQACRNMVARGELIGVAVLVIIGAVLIALAPEATLRRALAGAWGVFGVQNAGEAGVEREEAQGKRLATLAREAGVEHFVYTSVGSAHKRTGIPHFDNKWRI